MVSATSSALPLRSAVARLSRAALAFLKPTETDVLPLGEVREQELRDAALRVLVVLGDEDAQARLDRQQWQVGDRALQALAALDLSQIDGVQRSALAVAVASLHADLRALMEADVTRALLDGTPVGADLAALVFETDPEVLDPDAQVSFCQAAQRLESAAHARLGAGLVAFAGSTPRHTAYWVDDEEHTLTDVRSSELASALSWSSNKARTALESARIVNADLDTVAEVAASGGVQPAAFTAIAEGVQFLTASIDAEIERTRAAMRLDTDSAPDLADRIWELTSAREELVQRYDTAIGGYAVEHTLAETKRKVRDTLVRLDPQGFEARRSRAREVQSDVALRPLPDAMAMLTAVMPAEHANACYQAIEGAARDVARTDPEAPIGVRRSAVMYAFCARRGAAQAADADASTAGRAKRSPSPDAFSQGVAIAAHVDLVMTLDTFLGLSEAPAECVGVGPIPARAAREFLADSAVVDIRRLLVDPHSGHALDVGSRRYQLTAGERAFLFARDRVCRHPGCNQPAVRCDADHATPYQEGGATRADNLGTLCRRHHLEKTHAGWQIEEGRADGACIFVSPLGRRYVHPSESVLPWVWPGADGLPSPDDGPHEEMPT